MIRSGERSTALLKKNTENNFDFPKFKLSLKTKTESGVEFETNGSHDLDKSRTQGSLKTKLKFADQGVVVSESWNTNAELDTELTYEPSRFQGVKLTLSSSFLAASGHKTGKLRAGYRREYFSGEGDVDLQVTGPVVKASGVLMYKGWYAGYLLGYSTATAKLANNDVAVGYQGNDFTVHSSLADIQDLHTSVSSKTEVGLTTNYNVQTSNVSLGVAGKYTLDDGAVLKTKVNNLGQVGISYSQNVRDGVKLTLSTLVDGRNINAGGHKLGVALDFEP
ncbi:hypothetical protein EMCRGX_G030795 [Ephydatia muelleri]